MYDVCNVADDAGGVGDVGGNDDGGGDVDDGHGGEDTGRGAVDNAACRYYERAVSELVPEQVGSIRTKRRLCKVSAIAFARARSRIDVRCSQLDVPPS